MRTFYKTNLQNLCNHRLVGDSAIDTGLDGIYIDRADWRLTGAQNIDGIDFDFYTGEKDNVECDRQVLRVSAAADRLHIAGFSYWGETTEQFRIVYADGTSENVTVPFMDWAKSAQERYWSGEWDGGDIETVYHCVSSGVAIHVIYMHRATVELHGKSPIEEIVFPDNFFVHVFALTLEKNREDNENA